MTFHILYLAVLGVSSAASLPSVDDYGRIPVSQRDIDTLRTDIHKRRPWDTSKRDAFYRVIKHRRNQFCEFYTSPEKPKSKYCDMKYWWNPQGIIDMCLKITSYVNTPTANNHLVFTRENSVDTRVNELGLADIDINFLLNFCPAIFPKRNYYQKITDAFL